MCMHACMHCIRHLSQRSAQCFAGCTATRIVTDMLQAKLKSMQRLKPVVLLLGCQRIVAATRSTV